MNKNKLLNLRYKTLLTIFVVIFIIGGARTYDDIKRNSEIIKNKSTEINKRIENSYNQKLANIKELLSFSGQILSTSSLVKELIKNSDREALYNYSEKYFLILKQVTKNKNIRMHYHLPNHKSFLRVHKKDLFGDDLKDIRPIITETIFEEESLSGFEHGKHDKNQITYRMTFPIFDDDKLLAVFEVGIDFNNMIQDIEKEFKEQGKNIYLISRIREGTINFDDYEDFGVNINRCLYNKSEKVTPILEEYERVKTDILTIDDLTYSLTFDEIKIRNFEEEQIGSFAYIIDITEDMKQNKRFFYASISKPILAVVLLLVFIYFIFQFFFKQFNKMEKRTKNILNEQSSFILLTDGEKMLDCNLTLLQFYGLDNIQDFRNKYECICNTFEKGTNYIQKNNSGLFWIDYMLQNKNKSFKVCIKDINQQKNIFTISIKKFVENKDDEDYYVITLANITDLEKTNLKLLEQSKQASLGEMLANIAHQWRQPLSAISIISSSTKLYQELGTLKNEDVSASMDMIIGKTKYLSETIDIFRNYLNENKEKKELVIQERIDIALLIIDASLKDNHIKLINNIDYEDKIRVMMVAGELSQVLINIINNAKDILLEKNILNPKIILSMNKIKNRAIITIEDNAGGIDDKIISNIFEPYFTTKHKTQGTGLGLHMSYKIIKESLKGELYVKNTDLGAKFFIEIPLDIKD